MRQIKAAFDQLVSIKECEHAQTDSTDACEEMELAFHVHPIAMIQMLAWGRSGFLPDGTMIVCTDWDDLGDHLKGLLRDALALAARRIVTGELEPKESGDYTVRVMQMQTVIKEGWTDLRPPDTTSRA